MAAHFSPASSRIGSRVARRRARIAVVVGALLCSAVLTGGLSPAFADTTTPGGTSTDGGNSPGGGSSGGGGGSSSGGHSYGCAANGARTDHGQVVSKPDWPSCTPGSWGTDFSHRLCGTGYLVFRFYGRVDGSVSQMTASRVNYLHNNCQASDAGNGIDLYLPNPQDDIGSYSGAPWHSGQYTTFDGLPSSFTDSRNGASGRRLTSNPPIYSYSNNGASCASVMTPGDPVGAALADPSRKKYVTDQLTNIYRTERKTYTDATARTYNDTTSTDQPRGSITRTTYGDGHRCSTPFDFVSYPNTQNRAVVGTCYIPTNIRGMRFTNTNGSAAYGIELVDGEHVDTQDGVYANNNYNNDKSYRQAWRRLLDSQVAAGKLGSYTPIQSWDNQSLVYPYNSTKNLSLVADQIAHHAVCTDAPRVVIPPKCTTNCSGGVSGPAPTGHQVITMTVPQVFQNGGTSRVQTITATNGAFTCPTTGHQTCSETSLGYTLQIIPHGSWVACAAGQTTGCDYAITQQPVTQTPIQNGMTLQVEFFRAANPGEYITARLTNLHGTYSWTDPTQYYYGCDLYASDGSCKIYHQYSYTPSGSGSFDPTPAIDYMDGSHAPANDGSINLDVIGANSNP